MRGQRGFVLLNALVLVAALSAAVVWMLARADGARLRIAASTEATQLALYLDAFEALALIRLSGDTTATDHPGEAWAQEQDPVPLDRGEIAGRISDIQGRFNLNWLANPEDPFAEGAFDRLTAGLGIAPGARDAIKAFLRPGGPRGTPLAQRFASAPVPTNPVGGAMVMLDQLATIPGLEPRDLARLRPHLTALPGDAKLNLNTASKAVLASLYPGLTSAKWDQIMILRTQRPFTAASEFLVLVGQALAEGDAPEPDPNAPRFEPARLGVRSQWFEVAITARLDTRQARRSVRIERLPPPRGAHVTFRLSHYD